MITFYNNTAIAHSGRRDADHAMLRSCDRAGVTKKQNTKNNKENKKGKGKNGKGKKQKKNQEDLVSHTIEGGEKRRPDSHASLLNTRSHRRRQTTSGLCIVKIRRRGVGWPRHWPHPLARVQGEVTLAPHVARERGFLRCGHKTSANEQNDSVPQTCAARGGLRAHTTANFVGNRKLVARSRGGHISRSKTFCICACPLRNAPEVQTGRDQDERCSWRRAAARGGGHPRKRPRPARSGSPASSRMLP